MRRELLMGIVTAILLGACVFIYCTNASSGVTFWAVSDDQGVCNNMDCFINNFIICSPAKVDWESENDGIMFKSSLEIVGIVDSFCSFKMTRGNELVRECYFKQDVLGVDLAEQFFKGKDKGYGQIIADSCK